mmetsp:Transcript_61548/g.194800  ORF Transcript_61548/g.194800 Transcript_61548/m.194800 type:complete len:340 (-) Transcript_61548:891-1910(-)
MSRDLEVEAHEASRICASMWSTMGRWRKGTTGMSALTGYSAAVMAVRLSPSSRRYESRSSKQLCDAPLSEARPASRWPFSSFTAAVATCILRQSSYSSSTRSLTSSCVPRTSASPSARLPMRDSRVLRSISRNPPITSACSSLSCLIRSSCTPSSCSSLSRTSPRSSASWCSSRRVCTCLPAVVAIDSLGPKASMCMCCGRWLLMCSRYCQLSTWTSQPAPWYTHMRSMPAQLLASCSLRLFQCTRCPHPPHSYHRASHSLLCAPICRTDTARLHISQCLVRYVHVSLCACILARRTSSGQVSSVSVSCCPHTTTSCSHCAMCAARSFVCPSHRQRVPR